MIKALNFILFYFFLYPVLKLKIRILGLDDIWVIGGHAGKTYADNSAALHTYISSHTGQTIIWITGNRRLYREFLDQGLNVLLKDTVKARHAVTMASVLIRSHGYGDIDSYIGRYIPPAGLIVHLNHCMNHLKAGQMYSPLVKKMSLRQKRRFERKISNFDYLLASSPLEQKNFRLSIPSKADRIVLGGGAHLDSLIGASDEKIILYFPTWREKGVNSKLSQVDLVEKITSDQRFNDWLTQSGYQFVICMHINNKIRFNCATWPNSISLESPDQIQESLLKCSVLISDYSGLILDALYLDKPVIFFPYDLNDYLKIRFLYVNYEEFCFGPLVMNSEELISTLVTKHWQDISQYKSNRSNWYSQMFPIQKGSYAQASYTKINQLLKAIDN